MLKAESCSQLLRFWELLKAAKNLSQLPKIAQNCSELLRAALDDIELFIADVRCSRRRGTDEHSVKELWTAAELLAGQQLVRALEQFRVTGSNSAAHELLRAPEHFWIALISSEQVLSCSELLKSLWSVHHRDVDLLPIAVATDQV